MLAKALYITQDITFVAEQRGSSAFETPDTGRDPAVLLDRLAAAAAAYGIHEMSVILNRDVALHHGFPDSLPASRSKCEEHPVMLRVRERDWRCNRVRRWMTFQRRDTPTIHVGIGHWMSHDQARNPLWDNDPAAAAYLLWRFQNISGLAYHASPGVMGTQMLKALYPNNTVTWQAPLPADVQLTRTEYNYVNPDMAAALTSGYVHIYDTNRAYLASAQAADLARTPLGHTGPTAPFKRTIAGVWQVVVPTWNDKLLPHPMGSNRTPGEITWVTTATLALVEEVARDRLIEFPRILDSYTAAPLRRDGKLIPCTSRITREWASKINVAIQRCVDEPISIERDKLIAAFKGCYQQSINGLWKDKEKSHIFRLDWYYTNDALAGANMYRKLRSTRNCGGPTPIRIGNVDAIHFVSDKEDPKDDRLKFFLPGDMLGRFSVDTLTAEQWHGAYL